MYFGGLVTAVFWGLKNNCVLSLLVFGVLLFTVKYIVLFMQSLGLHAAPLAVYKFKTEMYIYCCFFLLCLLRTPFELWKVAFTGYFPQEVCVKCAAFK